MLDKVKKNIPKFFLKKDWVHLMQMAKNQNTSIQENTLQLRLQLSAKLIMVMCTCIDKIQWYVDHGISVTVNYIC